MTNRRGGRCATANAPAEDGTKAGGYRTDEDPVLDPSISRFWMFLNELQRRNLRGGEPFSDFFGKNNYVSILPWVFPGARIQHIG